MPRASCGFGHRPGDLPGNDAIEDEVRSYIDLFHADTQPRELAALRAIAGELDGAARPVSAAPRRRRLARHGDAPEQRLPRSLLRRLEGRPRSPSSTCASTTTSRASTGPRGRVLDVLNIEVPSAALGGRVHLALTVRDYDDLRGALHRDARGRSDRGDLAALRALEAQA